MIASKNRLIFVSVCLLVISLGIFAIEAGYERTMDYDVRTGQALSLQQEWFIKPSLQWQEVYLVAWWDIMLSRNIWYYNKREGYDRIFGSGKYNPITEFSGCNSDSCVLFFNLESPFHPKDNDIQMGGFTFRANTGNIEVLNALHIPKNKGQIPMILSLANNHLVNGWAVWLETTQMVLDNAGFWFVGADADNGMARKFWKNMVNGIQICLSAYSYEWKKDIKVWWRKITRNPIITWDIIEDLRKMDELSCNVKIVSLHRWSEYRLNPNKKQIDLAHELIDAGTDLILGWHSHIPWKIEKYNWKYIFYSLGNFIFDQEWWKTASGREFDYIYDYTLKRKTVPTYIAMLAGLKLVKNGSGVQILLDKLHFDTVSRGVHQPLDDETSAELVQLLRAN